MLLGIALAGCGKKSAEGEATAMTTASVAPRADAAALLAGFVVFESKVGRYKVRVPAKPEVKSEPMTIAGKLYAAEWMHATTDGRAAYMLQWNEAQPDASSPQFLANYARTIMSGVGANVLSIGDVTVLGQIPAVESTGKHPKTGAVYLRLFVVDGHVYRLMTGGVTEARAKAYFDSFERT